MQKQQSKAKESIESTVADDGVVNVRNNTETDPEVRSVFIDLFDAEAVACSCKDWEHRKPAEGCSHIQYVNTEEGLLARACNGGEGGR